MRCLTSALPDHAFVDDTVSRCDSLRSKPCLPQEATRAPHIVAKATPPRCFGNQCWQCFLNLYRYALTQLSGQEHEIQIDKPEKPQEASSGCDGQRKMCYRPYSSRAAG